MSNLFNLLKLLVDEYGLKEFNRVLQLVNKKKKKEMLQKQYDPIKNKLTLKQINDRITESNKQWGKSIDGGYFE